MATRAELARELGDTSEAKQAVCRNLIVQLEGVIGAVRKLAAGKKGAVAALDALCGHRRSGDAVFTIGVGEALMLESVRLEIIDRLEQLKALTVKG